MGKPGNIEVIKRAEIPGEGEEAKLAKNEEAGEKLETASRDLGYEEKRDKIFEESLEKSAKEGEPIIQRANEGEEAFHTNRKEASKIMHAESAKFRFEQANKNPGKPNFFDKTDSEVAKISKDKTIADARAEDPSLMGEGSTEAYKRGRANAHERGEINDSRRIENSSEFHGFKWGELNGKEAYKNPGDLTTAIGDKKMLEEVQIDALAKNTTMKQVPEKPKNGTKESIESNPSLAGAE